MNAKSWMVLKWNNCYQTNDCFCLGTKKSHLYFCHTKHHKRLGVAKLQLVFDTTDSEKYLGYAICQTWRL